MSNENRRVLSEMSEIRAFVTGGKAHFTLENDATAERVTYRVMRPRGAKREDTTCPLFVSVLTGPDNTSSYSYLGTIFRDAQGAKYVQTRKSKFSPSDKRAKGFAWLVSRLVSGRAIPAPMKFWHEGVCAACARKLTVPISIATGVGPGRARALGIVMEKAA